MQGNCSTPAPTPLPSAVPIDVDQRQCVIYLPKQGCFPALDNDPLGLFYGPESDTDVTFANDTTLWLSGLYFMASEIDEDATRFVNAYAVYYPGNLYITDTAFLGPTWDPVEDRLVETTQEVIDRDGGFNKRTALLVQSNTLALLSGAFLLL